MWVQSELKRSFPRNGHCRCFGKLSNAAADATFITMLCKQFWEKDRALRK